MRVIVAYSLIVIGAIGIVLAGHITGNEVMSGLGVFTIIVSIAMFVAYTIHTLKEEDENA